MLFNQESTVVGQQCTVKVDSAGHLIYWRAEDKVGLNKPYVMLYGGNLYFCRGPVQVTSLWTQYIWNFHISSESRRPKSRFDDLIGLTSDEFYSHDRIFMVLFRLCMSLHSSFAEVFFFVFTGNRPAWIVFCARCEDGQIRKNSKGLWDLLVKIVKLPKSKHAKDIFAFDDINNLYAKLRDISTQSASKSDLISCTCVLWKISVCVVVV